ncbi:nose resistant to fluoxetine protein 6 [Pelomyxa schiedti]|nr:nose resistant to fluoxetine protein 6 [Pelomyxa schiedti]
MGKRQWRCLLFVMCVVAVTSGKGATRGGKHGQAPRRNINEGGGYGTDEAGSDLRDIGCDEALEMWAAGTYPNSDLMSRFSAKKIAFDDMGNYQNCLTIADTSHFCSCGYTILNTATNETATTLSGLCVPLSCNSSELETRIKEIARVVWLKTENFTIVLPRAKCPDENPTLKDSPGGITILVLFSLLVILILVSTLYQVLVSISRSHETISLGEPYARTSGEVSSYHRQKEMSTAESVYTSGSLVRNIPSLIATVDKENMFPILNGIRVMSLSWVIIGHSIVFIESFITDYEWLLWISQFFIWQIVTSTFFSVDTFFFLSGFLAAYYIILEIPPNRKILRPVQWISIYTHRYIRLTPIWLFVTLCVWLVLPYVTTGPFWLFVDVDNCKDYWWTNVLYINNIYPWSLSSECADWGWYLANDMQFFLLAPIFVAFYMVHEVVGWAVIIFCAVGSVVVTICLMGFNGLTMYYFAEDNTGYWDDVYTKPWCRIQPYLVGVGFAFLVHKFDPRKTRLSQPIFYILWGITVLCLGIPTFGAYRQYASLSPDAWSTWEDAFYAGSCRFLWGLGIAAFIFLCTSVSFNSDRLYRNGITQFLVKLSQYIANILSHPAWTPLARLTYCTYLIHPFWLMLVYDGTPDWIPLTSTMFLTFAFGNIVIATVLASILYLVIEKPMANLEAVLLGWLGVIQRKTVVPPKQRYSGVNVPPLLAKD